MSDPEKKPGPFDGIMDAAEKALEEVIGKPAVAHIKKTVQDATSKQGAPPWSKFADDIKARAQEQAGESVADEASRSLFEARVRALVARMTYWEGYKLLCERDKTDPAGRLYLQVQCLRPDAVTGVMGVGRGGKAYLSPYMTNSEIARKVLGLYLAYSEHEVREGFKIDGKAVFGPHISLDALLEAADKLDFRDEPK